MMLTPRKDRWKARDLWQPPIALFNALMRDHPGQWAAVLVEDQEHWRLVAPRSQGALLSALETDEHAIIERIADVLAPLCNDDLERAFVVARDALAAAARQSGDAKQAQSEGPQSGGEAATPNISISNPTETGE